MRYSSTYNVKTIDPDVAVVRVSPVDGSIVVVMPAGCTAFPESTAKGVSRVPLMLKCTGSNDTVGI